MANTNPNTITTSPALRRALLLVLLVVGGLVGAASASDAEPGAICSKGPSTPDAVEHCLEVRG